MERVVPPRKDRPIAFELPPVLTTEDARVGGAAVLTAVAQGRITPSEAQCRTLPQNPSENPSAMIQVNFV
jgi:hypothetical protein